MRKQAYEIDKRRAEKFVCPECGKKKVKRVSYAVWECNSCGAKIAGGAYTLNTESGKLAQRAIRGE